MKYIFFRFNPKIGQKVFDFGEEALARLSKLGVQRSTLRKIDLFVQKPKNWIFSVSERASFKISQNCGSNFNKNNFLHVRKNELKKSFSFWRKPIFLSRLRAKNFCFSAIHCQKEIQNRILPMKRDVHGLWLIFQNWTNTNKTGTNFAIFVLKKTHPSRGWYYFNKLMMGENDSAAG